jgi:hypothetical protein
MIYEGTNTIQALDLLGRKVLGDMGARLMKFGKAMQDALKPLSENPAMQEFLAPFNALQNEVQKLTMEIGQKAMKNPDEVGAAAVPYLRAIGHLVFSFAWAGAAGVAMARLADPKTANDPFYKAKIATARFYFAKLYPESAALIAQARAGAGSLMSLDEAQF